MSCSTTLRVFDKLSWTLHVVECQFVKYPKCGTCLAAPNWGRWDARNGLLVGCKNAHPKPSFSKSYFWDFKRTKALHLRELGWGNEATLWAPALGYVYMHFFFFTHFYNAEKHTIILKKIRIRRHSCSWFFFFDSFLSSYSLSSLIARATEFLHKHFGLCDEAGCRNTLSYHLFLLSKWTLTLHISPLFLFFEHSHFFMPVQFFIIFPGLTKIQSHFDS